MHNSSDPFKPLVFVFFFLAELAHGLGEPILSQGSPSPTAISGQISVLGQASSPLQVPCSAQICPFSLPGAGSTCSPAHLHHSEAITQHREERMEEETPKSTV